jgi:hypothetical protein
MNVPSYTQKISFTCFLTVFAACGGAGGSPTPPAHELVGQYVEGIQFGMSVAEARQRYPQLKWRPYWGWGAEFSEPRGGYESFGVRTSASGMEPAESAIIGSIHLFAQTLSPQPPDFSAFPEVERQEGCGGLSHQIQVYYWSFEKLGVVWTKNPDAEDGSPAVHLVLTQEKPEPQRHVFRFSRGPCRGAIAPSDESQRR